MKQKRRKSKSVMVSKQKNLLEVDEGELNAFSEGEDLDLMDATENEIGVINQMLQAGPVDDESIECGMLKSPPVSDSDSSDAKIDQLMIKLSAEEKKAVESSDISVG